MQKISSITDTADTDGEFTDGNVAGGVSPTILPAAWFNTIQRELVNAVLAGGLSLDPTNDAQVIAALKSLFLQKTNNLSEIAAAGADAVAQTLANLSLGRGLTGTIGQSRNAVMTCSSVSASQTFTADELIVETELGGIQYRINSINLAVNLAATGAGGMDTGTAPASGFVALYVIYNPTTQTAALLAKNATSVKVNEVYSGINMPSGYTASALVAVWPTNASGQLIYGQLINRKAIFQNTSAVTSTAVVTNGSVSLVNIVPLNAKTIDGFIAAAITTGSGTIYGIASSDSVSGLSKQVWGYSTNSSSVQGYFGGLPLLTPQKLYYSFGYSGGTAWSWQVGINGYEF